MFWKVLEEMRRRVKVKQVKLKNVDGRLLTSKKGTYDELKGPLDEREERSAVHITTPGLRLQIFKKDGP